MDDFLKVLGIMLICFGIVKLCIFVYKNKKEK